MYKENPQTSKKPKQLCALIIISAIAAAVVLDAAIVYFSLPYRSLVRLLMIIVLGIGVYIMIRNVMTQYEYSVSDSDLSVISRIGEIERIIVKIPLSDIDFVAPCNSQKAHNGVFDNFYNAKKSLEEKDCYVCFFKDGQKCYKLIFEPSEKLLNFLMDAGVNVHK